MHVVAGADYCEDVSSWQGSIKRAFSPGQPASLKFSNETRAEFNFLSCFYLVRGLDYMVAFYSDNMIDATWEREM